MKIRIVPDVSGVLVEAAIIVTYFAGEGMHPQTESQLARLKLLDFEASRKRGEVKGSLYRPVFFRGSPSVALVGLGDRGAFSTVRWLRVVEAGARFLSRRGFTDLAVVLPSAVERATATRAAVEGVVRGVYDEGLLKTVDRVTYGVDTLTVVGESVDMSVAARALTVAESANLARDLLNLPPNDLTPSALANRAQEVGAETGLVVNTLDETEIAELGMGAIQGVARGSAEPPRVIDMAYGDESAPVKLAIVGKGLTFDSGGLSLKTAAGMEWMKGDMGAAAAVVGAMRAIGVLKPSGVFVRGLIGAVENMPGPAAMKPGDVLRTFNGKTIEVLNTDAEGRLVLSDLLAYAQRLGATHIVDLATLTGAAVIALGHEAAAILGRPQAWVDTILASADRAMERLWQLPLYPEYRRQMDSDIADMKNVGGRPGGAITAASLLAEFPGDVPWAHLDIAGTAWLESKTDFAPTGGTGYGVATLVELAEAMGASGG